MQWPAEATGRSDAVNSAASVGADGRSARRLARHGGCTSRERQEHLG